MTRRLSNKCKYTGDWWSTQWRDQNPTHTRQGFIIQNDGIVCSEGGYGFDSAMTICSTIYVFNKNQHTTVIGMFDNDNNDATLQLMVQNGRFRVKSARSCGWGGNNICSNSDADGSNYSLYEEGWNYMCFVSNSNWQAINFPHFSTTSRTDSVTLHGYKRNERISVGGSFYSRYAEYEFQGIIIN